MKMLQERLAYVYEQRPDLEGEKGQIGLVRASGASKSVVNQWISGGIKSMDIMYALRVEESLGFSHIWLMTGQGDPMAKPGERISLGRDEQPRMTLATPKELDLLDLYRRSTDRGQADIFDAAEIAPKRRSADLSVHKA